jgi:hypothetical protein
VARRAAGCQRPKRSPPKGARKRFVFPYRSNGAQWTFVLRPTFPTLSWKDAQKQVIELQFMLSRGVDPAAERARAKAAPPPRVDTFASVVAQFSKVYPDTSGLAGC